MAHLKDVLGDTVKDRCAHAHLTPLEEEVRKCVLRVFAARGSPPDPKEIAEILSGNQEMPEILPIAQKKPDMLPLPSETTGVPSLSSESPGTLPVPLETPVMLPVPSEIEVLQALARLHAVDILTLRGGKIVAAYPFSAAGTRHLVVFSDGHTAYALCAADALGIHFMLNEDITVRSLCPECEREIVIVLKDGKVLSCDPAGAIEFVKARDRCGCHADACCPDLNFFCGADHLARWKERGLQSRDGVVLTLDEALEESREIFEGLLR